MLADFQNFFIFGLSKKFAIKLLSCFQPHINCVAALPCETKNLTFTATAVTKTYTKFIYFLLNVIRII